MQPSSSTTKSSQRVANVDWKKRVPLELQQMQEEASSHSTDLWLFAPQMELKLC